LQRSGARLGGDDLNGAIVDHLQAADAGGGAVFILGATLDVRRRDVGVAVIGRIVQQRQGKGDIVGLQRRAVAVDQIRPQLDGVGQIIGADLPGLRQSPFRLALAVQADQAAEDHVGHVLVPAVGEQIRVENPLRLRDARHHGVFTQLGGGRYPSSVAGRRDAFGQRFRLHAGAQPQRADQRQRRQPIAQQFV
jgi:hypothetical protein